MIRKWRYQIRLYKTCDNSGILAFIETRLEDGVVLKVHKAEELQGAELMVFAEAEFQAIVTNGSRGGFAFCTQFICQLFEWQFQKPLQVFSFCWRIVVDDDFFVGKTYWL